MENAEIGKYYDDFVREQIESGVNDRIYGLYERLKNLGLNSHSNMLELGCGIGVSTYLLAKTVTSGHIEAVDLSEKSIEFARSRTKNKNVSLFAGDIVTYQPSSKSFDFITLFDVIEHIPLEKHRDLFLNLSRIADPETKILINIPNPEYIKFDIANNPDELQIIDQPVPLPMIIENITNAGLELHAFETYSVWAENDYQFFLIRKKLPFKEVLLSTKRGFIQKARIKTIRTLRKTWYRYR